MLLVYSGGPRVLGSYDLRGIRGAQEHVEVGGLKFQAGTVAVDFSPYAGSGAGRAIFAGTLTYDGKAQLDYEGPFTIDYGEGRMGLDPGPGVVREPRDAATALKVAPAGFRAFITARWKALQASDPDCTQPALIAVNRVQPPRVRLRDRSPLVRSPASCEPGTRKAGSSSSGSRTCSGAPN